MKHYIIMIKSYNIDEAGDDILEDAAVGAVKHTHEEAMAGVKHIADEYAEDGYVVMQILDGIYRSAKEKHEIIIK